MKEARKQIAEYHFAMTLKQLGNQAHRMQTQDPETNIDRLYHPLNIFDKKFEIEMLITPKDILGDLLEDLQKKEMELQVAQKKIENMIAQKEIDDKKVIEGTC